MTSTAETRPDAFGPHVLVDIGSAKTTSVEPARTLPDPSVPDPEALAECSREARDDARHPARSLNRLADSRTPRLTIVVPTRNEAQNVEPLLDRLAVAGGSLPIEVMFVDDSDDETAEVIAAKAADCPMGVRLIHRPAGGRRAGLSGAVVCAARQARGEWVLVMDADLQHPPEVAVRLALTAMRQNVDVVTGTRYAGAGSGSGLDGAGRAATSSLATRVVKAAFPRRLATVSDPMSGLFAFRRSAIELDRLNPVGFKILLEILVRHPAARVAEVAYQFAPRLAGESKASFREGLAFGRHLVRLRRGVLGRQLRRRPMTSQARLRQNARAIGFGLVGLSGVAVNTLVLWLFHHGLGRDELLAATLATQASTVWNFGWTDLLVYRGAKRGTRTSRAARFWAMNNLLLLARLPIIVVLMGTGMDVLWANGATLVLLFVVRFLLSDRVIYATATADPEQDSAGPGGAGPGGGGPEQGSTRDPVRQLVDLTVDPAALAAAAEAEAGTGPRKRSMYLTYRYDIAGVVRIGSQIKLPELEFFRAQWIAEDDLDIAVRVGDVGRRTPRRRAELTEYLDPTPCHGLDHGPVSYPETTSTVRYEEHLGRWGANFRIDLGSPINIEVGPLLAASPHVVYTNIIEALLRFVMVSRGRMLLHSACVELDGVGVMLSALTDTGKTATILRLLREHGGKFLSDDMTIIAPDGTATCFPKPLTISAHTLRAVNAEDLTGKEWRRLQFQSRLHSKGGRSIALTLARFNLPIMGINAITQRLIPPPKYTVDRLVGARLGSTTTVRELFIIQRGTPHLTDLPLDATIDQLLTNTDDAYGFPPFKYLAPSITINGHGYTQLRAIERDILTSFLSHLRTRVLTSDSFAWADQIPDLIATGHQVLPPGAGDDLRRRPAGHDDTGTGILDEWPRWAVQLPTLGGST
jgi:dolichol-phosphate mannosyltransferase